jgi:hypothetical protein
VLIPTINEADIFARGVEPLVFPVRIGRELGAAFNRSVKLFGVVWKHLLRQIEVDPLRYTVITGIREVGPI